MTNINQLLNEANELVPRISFEEASAILNDANTIILDVREGQELRESGKIKGAIHVPRGLLEFIFKPEDHVEDSEKMKILIYCAAGVRSYKTSFLMKEMGFKQVYELSSGISGWKAASKAISIE